MMTDTRDYNAYYYDLSTNWTADIAFYAELLKPEARVLELGCGSGRVTGKLLEFTTSVVGVDLSEAMLKRAREKVGDAPGRWLCGDITQIALGQHFDLIIAPFRVFQALEHDEQVHGLFDVIRRHLAPQGLAILNVFNPFLPRDKMPEGWVQEGEISIDEQTLPDGDILRIFDERAHLDPERQVLYPKLIYRRYRDETLVDEHLNPICMRYYYPEEFTALIEDHGFSIVDRWGGYSGETYGEGGELVVAFR